MSLTNKEKNIIVVALLLGGAIFILILFPPHNICDTYVDQFKKKSENFFQIHNKAFETCKKTSSSGGCLLLFSKLLSFSQHLLNTPSECQRALSNSKVKKVLWENLELIALLYPLGWLSSSDQDLFCQLKHWSIKFYGENSWEKFESKITKVKVKNNKAREEHIFSQPCIGFF